MKNYIKSKYNIYPDKIYVKDKHYFFFSNNDKIYIVKTNKNKKELDDLVYLSNELYNNGIPISTFLINSNGEFYTKKDNYYIVLLKYNNLNNYISINDIQKFTLIENSKIKEKNVVNDWEKEIDSIEKEMTEYNKEFPLIQKSLNYFIGLSENAIQMIKDIQFESNSVSHNITSNNFNAYEIYNPLNLVRSSKIQDIVNYYKYNFYNYTINYDELDKTINSLRSNKNDLIYLFCMFLYQSEYFEMVKLIILHKKEEKELNKYINRIVDYKEFLKYLKSILHNIQVINELEWIDK